MLFTSLAAFRHPPDPNPAPSCLPRSLLSSFSLFVLTPITTSLAFVGFISSFHFCAPLFFSSANFATLTLVIFYSFFHSITSLTSLRSTLRSAPPPVGSILTKCLPVRRLSPWARADSLRSFSSSWLRLPWQQATGRNTPHIVFPRQQSHHLEQIDELPWSGRASGNNCCILYLSHVKS